MSDRGAVMISGSGDLSSLGATLRGAGATRMNFSVPNLLSAAMFSRRVGDLEENHKGQPYGEFFDEILAFSTGCIFTAVAGFESFANELYADRKENFPTIAPALLDYFWEFFDQRPILDKFDFALMLRGAPKLNKGLGPAQSVASLVRLRNALMHFNPEWDNEEAEHRRLSDALSTKFDPTPFIPGPEGVFPRRWASHSCTSWAVTASVLFLEYFEAQCGLRSKVSKFKDRLTP